MAGVEGWRGCIAMGRCSEKEGVTGTLRLGKGSPRVQLGGKEPTAPARRSDLRGQTV